jgi:hypothetical protein
MALFSACQPFSLRLGRLLLATGDDTAIASVSAVLFDIAIISTPIVSSNAVIQRSLPV